MNFNEVWMLRCYLIRRIDRHVCLDIIVDLVARRIVIQMTSSYGGNIISVAKHRLSKTHRKQNNLPMLRRARCPGFQRNNNQMFIRVSLSMMSYILSHFFFPGAQQVYVVKLGQYDTRAAVHCLRE